MMTTRRGESGLTAVELLVTLFVAAAFLIAGYQLFNAVIKDGGLARAESRANTLASEYLSRYSGSATTPCSASSPLTDSPVTVDGLTNTEVSVEISCPFENTTAVSKITVTVAYNNNQSVSISSYVNVEAE